jgi:post-segregation antitoxin (ccd killing protein)
VQHVASLSIRVDDDLKKEMSSLDINWSDYIREAIKTKVAEEKRRKAGEELLASLKKEEHTVPEGFINETIRRAREAR